MANQLEIMNMALLYVGEEMITDGDTSKNADIVNAFFDTVLAAALSEHDWRFATRRENISYEIDGSSNPVPPAFGYTYKYLLPADYNHIVVEEDDEFDYREEYGYILTDSETLELTYVANVTNLSLLSSDFVDAVVTLLASKIAYSLTGTPSIGLNFEQLYAQKIIKAKMQDSSSIGLVSEDDSWIEER